MPNDEKVLIRLKFNFAAEQLSLPAAVGYRFKSINELSR